MPFIFGPLPAIDPTQPNQLAVNADGLIYAVTDTAYASPLAVTDLSGGSLLAVHVNATGLTQSFISPQAQVIWKSGAYTVPLASYPAIVAQMQASVDQVTQLRDQVTQALSLLGQGGTGGGVTIHSQLSGLGSDDHLQYLTNGRGDARYFTQAQVTNMVTAGDATSSAADRNRANHTGSQAQSSVTGLQGALVARPQIVSVSTGSEARPDGSASVWWVDLRSGVVSAPTNMQVGTDVWLSQTGTTGSGTPSDTSAPSVPTGLTSSGITSSQFTVSWTASTDNVGATGYEVQVGGVAVGTPTGTTYTVTGRASSTAYSVRVRARDAAGNWSALSTALTVTTSAGASIVEHSVFGASPIPGAGSANIYATTGKLVAQGFRLAAEQSTDWRVKGARLYAPNVTGAVPSTATVYVFKGPSPTLASIGTSANGTATMTGIAKGAWAEVRFPTPVSFGYFDRVWIVLAFSNGTHFVYPSTGATRYPATDGSAIGLEANDSRAQQYDPASGQSGVDALWGLDLIVDAGA